MFSINKALTAHLTAVTDDGKDDHVEEDVSHEKDTV